MRTNIRWLIPAACIIAFAWQPCYSIDLIISDSGRNTTWSNDLRIGDDFSVEGANKQPVRGVIAGTQAIEQFLVPMPGEDEIKDYEQSTKQNWVRETTELLKDRVHIATTNGATVFEIRLLQDTSKKSGSSLSLQDNPRTGRFGKWTYEAIGGLVSHLKERKEPVRITAALADSGSIAFARAVDTWKPYANTFRRVDLVDGRASLAEIRPVISALGDKRVRLFHTAGVPTAPAMSIGRKEVAETLLKSHRYLTQYTLTSNEQKSGAPDKPDQTPWMTSLAGSRACTVKRLQYDVGGNTIEQTLTGSITGQDFRNPITGWDPVDLDLHKINSLGKLGIMASLSQEHIVPSMSRSLSTGIASPHMAGHGQSSRIPAFFAIPCSGRDSALLREQMDHLADAAADYKYVQVLGNPGSALTCQLAETVSQRAGPDRIQLIKSIDGTQLASSSKRDDLSCIVGWKDQFDTTYKNTSFLVNREVADTLINGASTLEKTLTAMKDVQMERYGPLFAKVYSDRFGKYGGGLNETLGYLKKATGLMDAINKDMKRGNQGRHQWVTSNTLEKFGDIGFDLTTSKLLDHAAKQGWVRQSFQKSVGKVGSRIGAAGGIDAIRATSRIIGGRKWNPLKWDIETCELVTNAFSDAAAYGLGAAYATSVGAPGAADKMGMAFQANMALVREGSRYATQPLFDSALGAVRGEAATAVAQYEYAASQAAISGATVPRADEWFPKDQRRSLGINDKAFSRLVSSQQNYEQMSFRQNLRLNKNVSSTPSSTITEDARLHNLADFAKVKSETFQMSSANLQKYNPSSKKAQPGDIWVRSGSLGTIPHGGNYWGPQNQGDLHFDSIELVPDSADKTFIVPKHFLADKGPKMNFYRPLESNIDCVYQGQKMKLKDLPTPVKERIRNSAFGHDFSRLGDSVGKYRFAGLRQSSNQCIDSLLDPWEKALSDTGVDIMDKEGNSAKLVDHFRIGKTANPMSWPSIPKIGIGALGATLKKVEPPYFTKYVGENGSNTKKINGSINIPNTSSRNDITNAFSRIRSNTNLVLRGPTRLDKYSKSILDQRSIKVTRDPIDIKTPRPYQTVIESRQPGYKSFGNTSASMRNYKQLSRFGGMQNYESPSNALRRMETQKTLGQFTRNYTPKPFSMREGFYKYEDKRLGDMTDFRRFDSSLNSFNKFGSIGMLPKPDIGGVMLSGSAKVEGDGEALQKGNVSLVFQNSAGEIDFFKLQRFATALWGTYLSVEGPGISIDPIDEKVKEYGQKHVVRYIGQVHNTELGKVMRETDHLMKRWAIGTHRPDIEGFLTPDDFGKKLKSKLALNRASRFWFVPQGLTFKRSENMLLLSSGQMTVQTEYLDDNQKGEKNQANELFAKWLTENYDLVAAKYPIFKELFEYAQLVSLCTYLRENRVPMLWFIIANREIILTENSIDMVDQLVKKSDYKWYVKICGGVELQLGDVLKDESCYEDDPTLQAVESLLNMNSSGQDKDNAPVVFSTNDTSYTVASKNTLKLFSSSAEGNIIQTDMALVGKYRNKTAPKGSVTDQKEVITPQLELVRYYSPGLETRAQFGEGWHLLVPFRLETETQTPLSDIRTVPEKLVMVNLLSGVREVLHQEGIVDDKLRYVPADGDGLTDNLVLQPDGSWVLQDILRAKFEFDRDGDLRQMMLRQDRKVTPESKPYEKQIPDYTVKYQYDTKDINGQDIKILASIKQGDHTACVDWYPNSSTPQIAGIRVLQQGRAGPIEVLNYDYGKGGMLARVTSQSGRTILVNYENDNMRVVATRK